MVLASLLGHAKPTRRRSSAASFRSALARPSSSGTRLPVPGDEAIDDGNDTASVKTNNSDAASASATSATPQHRPASPRPPDYIADEAQLPAPADEPPDLRELNNSLEALAVVFPDVAVDVFREMLGSFDGESRLALVADALLKNRATWVKGRWRVADKGAKEHNSVKPTDRFRTPEYKKAALALASHKFAGLSRSSISAVLAEQNYSYLDAHRVLVPMSAKSWRFMFHSLFSLRSPVTHTEAENHPLIVYKSSGHGSIIPTIKATGSAELDRELYEALVAPLLAKRRATQEDADRSLAAQLNADEAEAEGATYECTCCFATAPFEEVTTCSHGDAAHVVCFRCVQHSVREAVFGQGWARTIDTGRGTLRCPAVDTADCPGVIPADLLAQALLSESRGGDTLQHLERRLADLSLVGSGLPLVRCPFCAYAEVDDIYVPYHEAPLRVRIDSLYTLSLICLLLGATPVLMAPLMLLIVVVALLPSIVAAFGSVSSTLSAMSFFCTMSGRSSTPSRPAKQGYLRTQLADAVTRFRRRRRGQQFRCQNPACARLSCLACSKAWTDIHVCHESSLVALRTQVEQAMSMAIKRVCPRCHTSFVKNAGCNKLTCPCGYKMCYVCRRDISGNDGPDAGYRHFCEHFRPHGDGRACAQCRKCNLWETEDTEAVLHAARLEAERKWRETEQRELSSAERAYLETGIAIGGGRAATATGSLPIRPASGHGLGFGLGLGLGHGPAALVRWAVSLPGVAWLFHVHAQAQAAAGPKPPIRFPSVPDILDWLLECFLV